MKEIITIYKKQRHFVESSLMSMLDNIDLTQYDEMKDKSIFSLYPSLKATYKINKNNKQATPLYTASGFDNTSLGIDRSNFLSRIQFNKDDIYISNSYINSRSATPYITIVIHLNDEYLVYDFELYSLLKELMLIEGDKLFSEISRVIYFLFGFLLVLFSLSLIFYGAYIIYDIAINETKEILAGFFRSIIALTLGLAIFDLAKTILEHEVFYKRISRNYNLENRLLARFLVSIIIALSIEALMVVFKIVLSDYSQMIHALYLILGVAVMIASLSIFIFTMRYQGQKD